MRKPKLSTRSWRSFRSLRRDEFLDTLRKSKFSNLFDDKFIDIVLARRDYLESFSLKVAVLQIPIFVFLIFSLIPIEASFSFLGISPVANKNLREILIIASSTLGVFGAACGLNKSILEDLLGAVAVRKSKGDKDVQKLLGLSYGIESFFISRFQGEEELDMGGGFIVMLIIYIVSLILFAFVVAVSAIYIHFLILSDIIRNPSYSVHVSIVVAAFVFVCDLLAVTIYIFQSGPWPMRNFRTMRFLEKLRVTDPEKANEMYREIAQYHMRKPWLLRVLTRPRIPSKLRSKG